MIELEHVYRAFQVGDTEVHALRDVTLTIPAGAYVSIMGPSGSGKSTLLNILGLLDRPSRGRYLLDGTATGELDDEALARQRRNKIGFVFQSFHLIPRLSAAENVALPLLLAGVDTTTRNQRVNDTLAAMGLSDRAHHRPDQLSGGQRQRVAIARAVVTRPAIVLADEPTGNLDRASGMDVVHTLERLHEQGITLLIVTHDPDLGSRASRRIHMVDGTIESDIPT